MGSQKRADDAGAGRAPAEATTPTPTPTPAAPPATEATEAPAAAPPADAVPRAEHDEALRAERERHEAELRAMDADFQSAWRRREAGLADLGFDVELAPGPRAPKVRRARVNIHCRGGKLPAGAEVPAGFDLTGVDADAIEEG